MNVINEKLVRSLHTLFEKASERANDQIGETPDDRRTRVAKDGGYKCIHLNSASFFDTMMEMMGNCNITDTKASKMTFVDVGCGVGEKVFFAETLGFNSFGLELRKPLIDSAKRLFRNLGLDTLDFHSDTNAPRLIQGDALEYDYSRFDVIYFYCPLHDTKLQAKLEERIAQTVKLGAIVVPFLARGFFCQHPEKKGENHYTTAAGWKRVDLGRGSSYFTKS